MPRGGLFLAVCQRWYRRRGGRPSWSCGDSNPSPASGFMFFPVRSRLIPHVAAAVSGTFAVAPSPSCALACREGLRGESACSFTDADRPGRTGNPVGDATDHVGPRPAMQRGRSRCAVRWQLWAHGVIYRGHRAILGTLHHEAIGDCRNQSPPETADNASIRIRSVGDRASREIRTRAHSLRRRALFRLS